MLYLLKEKEGAGECYYLISGKQYTVGRKNADIIISNDQSISRKHAIIKVEGDFATLTDCGSKYGTSHQDKRIEANTEVILGDKEVIKFGVFGSIFIVEKRECFITAGSSLNNDQKAEMKKYLTMLGGFFVNNWDSSCNYLTIQEIVLTAKVLHALIDNKSFVTPQYWKQFVDNMKNKLPPPNIEDFKPPVTEAFLNRSLLVYNPERKNLFKDKIFVFTTAKLKSKMEDVIKKTGGTCISWDTEQLTLLQIINSPKTYLFISNDEKEVPPSLQQIYEHIIKLKQRMIPIQEIAMAILLCSCEKDCNPNFNRLENVFMKEESEAQSQVFPLAFETQTQTIQTQTKQEIIVPSSLDEDLKTMFPVEHRESPDVVPSTSTFKRPPEEVQESPFKRVKLNNNSDTNMEKMKNPFISVSQKRKSEEVLEPTPKKSSLKENPFAMLRNKNSAKKVAPSPDNPFAALRVKKELIQSHDDNPFKRVSIEQNHQNENEKPSVLIEPSLDYTDYMSVSKTPSLSEIKWMSKSTCKGENIDIDDEFKEIYDRFKNSVVVEVLPLSLRCNNISKSVNETVNHTGRNFKKFKKVRPVRPQINIISTTLQQVSNVTLPETTNLSDPEDVEETPRPVVNKTKKTKRFNF